MTSPGVSGSEKVASQDEYFDYVGRAFMAQTPTRGPFTMAYKLANSNGARPREFSSPNPLKAYEMMVNSLLKHGLTIGDAEKVVVYAKAGQQPQVSLRQRLVDTIFRY